MSFELSRSSLEDLVFEKISRSRARSVMRLCERAGIPWLWSQGREVDLGMSPGEWLIELMREYYEKVSNERVVLASETDKELIDFPVACRGSSRYTAEVIDRKERLEDWLKSDYDKPRALFLSFTLSSDRVADIWEAFEVYREAMNHITSQLQLEKHLGHRPEYLWCFEPHADGYPHIHLVVFESRIPNIEELASWWSENYTQGKADFNGLDWEKVKKRELSSRVASYISKYVAKTLTFEDLDAEQSDEELRLFWLGLLWLSGRRSWSYSRKIGNIMVYGLVVGWTNSTDFLLGAFKFDAKIYSFVGCFSRVEIDDLKERGEFDFESFFNCSSSREDIETDSWNIGGVEELRSEGGDKFESLV